MKYRMLLGLFLSAASSIYALDQQERAFFGLTALQSTHPHINGEGFSVGVSDTEFDVTHPGLGWTGSPAYTNWFNNQTSIPQLNRTNPRIFMSAHREYAAKLFDTKHGSTSIESFVLPVTMNNPLKPLIWGYHGTWVTGAAASGELGPEQNSLGAAPKARLVLAGDTENFNHVLSLVPDGNPNRTVVMNRSFTGWSGIDGMIRRNSGVIGVNAAGNSFSAWSSDRMTVGGVSPHRSFVRWTEQNGYDLIVSGLSLESESTARADSSGSQRNQESIFTDYVVKTVGSDNQYDQTVGGTSLASPFMAGGATLVQQAYVATHTGRWLRVSQMERILKRSARFVDDMSTGLRYPVANFAAAVALAETYQGDPSLEPNFSITNLPPAVRVNATSSDASFLDPRFFRVVSTFNSTGMLEYTTASNHNGIIHVTGNRGNGLVNIALRNGWGDLARINFSEPGKKLVLAFDYDTKAGTETGDFNELFVGVKEMFGSDQFMNFDLSDDTVRNGRLAFRITYNRGQNNARIDLLQCSILPTIPADKYQVWQRASWTGAPDWDSTVLATALATNLHNGSLPRVEVSFTLNRATFRVNGQTLIDSAHTAPAIAMTRSTPYLHFQHFGTTAQQRLARLSATTEHGSKPIVSLEYARNRAIEGVNGPAASGVLTIHRTGPTNNPLTVYYGMAGTAANGQDFAFLPGAITLPAGIATTELIVQPLNDTTLEGSETAIVNLVTHSSYLVNNSYSSETVTIADYSDIDGDGIWSWDEDVNRNSDISDDDSNANLLPNYLDTLDRVPTNNVAPIANAGPAKSTIGINPVLLDGTQSSDPDGNIATFAWSIIAHANNGPVIAENASSSIPVIRWTAPTASNRIVQVRLTVTDNHGVSASATTTVTQIAGQVFNKTYPQVYFRGTPNGWGTSMMSLVTNYTWQLDLFVGSGTQNFKFDVYGDWSLNFGNSNNDAYADQGAGNIAITQGEGNYRIRFNDQTRAFSVTKIVANVPPVANAGQDTTTYQMEPVTLSGTASYDSDGQIVSYLWAFVEGYDGPANITNVTTATPTVQWHAPTISSRVARVRLTVTDNSGATASSTVTVTQVSTITYSKTYSQMYFRGTPNGWGSYLMTLVSNYTWEAVIVVGSGTQNFKFDVYGNWTVNFGENNGDGIAEQSGGNIAIAQGAGTYTIRFNDQTKRYWINKQIVNQPPVVNAGPNQILNSLGGATVYLDGSGSHDPDGSIIEYAWTQSSGPFAIISYAHPGNPNATVVLMSQTTNSTYTFSLRVTDNNGAMSTGTVTITQQVGGFNKVYPQVYFRGSANNWGTTSMTLVSNNLWETEATFGSTSNERFKFDIYGDWSLNFGENNSDGYADQAGGNIIVSQGAGTYRIRFNDLTRAYSVSKIGGSYARDFASMSVAGSMNGWSPSANNMQVIADYTWSGTFVLSGDVQFKFAANGGWGNNWGENDQPGTSAPLNGYAEVNGGNIRLTGLAGATYRITMHERTRAYSVTLLAGSETGLNRLLVGWEARYGIDLLAAGVADTDIDGEGLSNLAEYHLGTDPYRSDSDNDGLNDTEEIIADTDPLDFTSLLNVTPVNENGVIHLVWPVKNNRLYRLEASASLNSTWTITSDWMSTDGNTETMSAAPVDGFSFYRVRVGQPGLIGTTAE